MQLLFFKLTLTTTCMVQFPLEVPEESCEKVIHMSYVEFLYTNVYNVLSTRAPVRMGSLEKEGKV